MKPTLAERALHIPSVNYAARTVFRSSCCLKNLARNCCEICLTRRVWCSFRLKRPSWH